MKNEEVLLLKKSKLLAGKTITITGSKSISNRLLILRKLFGEINLKNISTSQDTELLQNALNSIGETIDIHHAGTAMRFLTAYFSIFEGKTTILTGSERMKQRPIKPLVEALKNLGANIEYLGKEGFPPLKIIGKKLTNNKVSVPGNISSQFITALLLIAAKLPNGLSIELTGKITSRPYLEMTLQILNELGIKTDFSENSITVQPISEVKKENYIIESDWSSASYFYSLAALGRKEISLKSFKNKSLQADRASAKIYEEYFGIETVFNDEEKIMLIPKENFTFPEKLILDMNDCPDIAQTVCVTASALKIPFEVTGLETLKVKETDRLFALKNELKKIGCDTKITDNSIKSLKFSELENEISIATYNDHRMAMSFAPYCIYMDLKIENPSVVVKSYPNFWQDFHSVITAI